MSGFQVGDVVVCVDAGPHRNRVLSPTVTLRLGGVYRVTAMRPAPTGGFYTMVDGEPPHVVAGYVHTGGWASSRFRKIRPASDEFISALRACKPEHIGEPVNV